MRSSSPLFFETPPPNLATKEIAMKTPLRIASLSLLAALCLAALPGAAGTLYDNGPVNGYANGWDIKNRGSGNSVSDSFALTAAMSTLTDVHFGEWTEVEAFPYEITWAIGATPFDNGLGTGSVKVSSTKLFYAADCCDVYDVSFTLPNIDLPFGTYWLTLSNGVGCGPFGCDGLVKWDENSGVGYTSPVALRKPTSTTLSTLSTPNLSTSRVSPPPEPGSLALLGSGVLGLGGMLRRRLPG